MEQIQLLVYPGTLASIEPKKNETWKLRNFVFGEEQWVWLAERGTSSVPSNNARPQIIFIQEKLPPLKQIESVWSEGGSLIEIVCGRGTWLALANKPTLGQKVGPLQALDTSHQFPKQLITRAWSKGDKVTYLYFNSVRGLWFLISEDTGKTDRQRVVVKKGLPVREIKKAWAQGRRITSLTYGAGNWVLLSEPEAPGKRVRQRFYASPESFPTAKIRASYSKKYKITIMAYSEVEHIWAFILEPTLDELPNFQQKVHFSKKDVQIPTHKLNTLCRVEIHNVP